MVRCQNSVCFQNAPLAAVRGSAWPEEVSESLGKLTQGSGKGGGGDAMRVVLGGLGAVREFALVLSPFFLFT